MPDYSKAQIYQLISDNGLVYIGSTTETLSRRLAKHKYYSKQNINITSIKLFENDTRVVIELIEKFPCNDIDELHKREGYWIRTLDCVNKCIAGRSRKEWFEDNPEYMKKWWKDNPEYLKEYTQKNKEQLLKNHKRYREKNKEEIEERRKQKIQCECGSIVRKSDLYRHKKTQKHLNYINNLEKLNKE